MSNIQISSVILWQRNGIRRHLEFKHNRVNVITGDPGQGKSSILYIIDYCLLSSQTKGISKTNIDSKVDWYGIKLSVDGNELVIARPSESAEETERAYFDPNGIIPEKPHLNARIENLKKILTSAFGIDPELRMPFGGRMIKANSKVTFRHFVNFSYQDQATIVAPDYLYIRQTDLRVQEGIARTFRMAIGAETIDTAIARNRLAELERKKSRQERKFELLSKSAHVFSDEVSELLSQAHSLGVIQHIPESYDDQFSVLRDLLTAPATPNQHQCEVERIDGQIFKLKAKNRRLQTFIDERPAYASALKETEDALKPIQQFNTNSDDIFPTPLANEVIARLQRELTEIRTVIKGRKSFPFIEEVKAIHAQNEQRIVELQNEMTSLKVNPGRYSPNEYYRYLGRLETKLQVFEKSEENASQIVPIDYDDEIASLESTVNLNEARTELVKLELNKLMNKRLVNLPLKGYPEFSAILSEKEMLIHVHSRDGSNIERMPDVGSASNYLYLHVSYFLAIHEIAKTRNIPWIPSFLVLDQVSTPYFSTARQPSTDVVSMDKVLQELNQFVTDMDEHGGFQIILLEHIGKEHWERLGLKKFHLVDRELRGDYGLILKPGQEYLQNEGQT